MSLVPDPSVTIVVVPRERFSCALRSLASIYDHTDLPFSLVYVDGGSPAHVRDRLREQAARRGFRLIRSERYLSPNRARNLGLAAAGGTYVVFVDNDVLVASGWLTELVRCAEETGAWLVGPLCLQNSFEDGVIHMAGATLEIEQTPAGRVLRAKEHLQGRRLAELPPLARARCDVVEFHCMLVRRAIFERVGALDENLLNTREHVDLCLSVRRAGGAVYFEPAALVTYLQPSELAWSDLPYFLRRWSKMWSRRSLEHFSRKWDVAVHPRHLEYLSRHRRFALPPFRRRVRQALQALRGRPSSNSRTASNRAM